MRLQKYLREHNIRYAIFAKELEITEQSLKNIVAGSRRPGLLLALKIEKLTNGEITPTILADDYAKVYQAKLKKMASNDDKIL